MILKSGNKYIIKSEDGSKTLSTFNTREEAEERLRQIEYFKHRKDNKK